MLLSSGDVKSIPVAAAADVAALVPAVAGQRIRVLGGILVAGAAGAAVKFISVGTEADTDLTGTLVIAANGELPIQPTGLGYFETIVGEPLKLACTGALNGVLRYQYIR